LLQITGGFSPGNHVVNNQLELGGLIDVKNKNYAEAIKKRNSVIELNPVYINIYSDTLSN
jgi:hypothetical protein